MIKPTLMYTTTIPPSIVASWGEGTDAPAFAATLTGLIEGAETVKAPAPLPAGRQFVAATGKAVPIAIASSATPAGKGPGIGIPDPVGFAGDEDAAVAEPAEPSASDEDLPEPGAEPALAWLMPGAPPPTPLLRPVPVAVGFQTKAEPDENPALPGLRSAVAQPDDLHAGPPELGEKHDPDPDTKHPHGKPVDRAVATASVPQIGSPAFTPAAMPQVEASQGPPLPTDPTVNVPPIAPPLLPPIAMPVLPPNARPDAGVASEVSLTETPSAAHRADPPLSASPAAVSPPIRTVAANVALPLAGHLAEQPVATRMPRVSTTPFVAADLRSAPATVAASMPARVASVAVARPLLTARDMIAGSKASPPPVSAPIAARAVALAPATSPAARPLVSEPVIAPAASIAPAIAIVRPATDPAGLPNTVGSGAAPAPVTPANPARVAVEPRPAVPVVSSPVAPQPVLPPIDSARAAALPTTTEWRATRRVDDPFVASSVGVGQPAANTSAIVAAASHAGQAGIDLTRDPGLQRMIDRIETLRDAADARDTRIRLIPDALGPVDIAVRRDGDAVRVHFTAADPATRALIADAQPRLSELADSRGVRIERATIDGGDARPGGGAGDQPRPQPQRPAPTLAAAPRPTTDADTITDDRIA